MEVDDVEDHEVKGEEYDEVKNDNVEKRKIMMLRMMVLRRRTDQDRDPHVVRAFAVEMHLDFGHFTRATLCESSQVKCRRPRSRTRLFASVRSTEAIFCENS